MSPQKTQTQFLCASNLSSTRHFPHTCALISYQYYCCSQDSAYYSYYSIQLGIYSPNKRSSLLTYKYKTKQFISPYTVQCRALHIGKSVLLLCRHLTLLDFAWTSTLRISFPFLRGVSQTRVRGFLFPTTANDQQRYGIFIMLRSPKHLNLIQNLLHF